MGRASFSDRSCWPCLQVLQGEDESKTKILATLAEKGIGAWSAVPAVEGAQAAAQAEDGEKLRPAGLSELDWQVMLVGGENPGGCSSEMHRKLCSWQSSPDDPANIQSGRTNKKKRQ